MHVLTLPCICKCPRATIPWFETKQDDGIISLRGILLVLNEGLLFFFWITFPVNFCTMCSYVILHMHSCLYGMRVLLRGVELFVS